MSKPALLQPLTASYVAEQRERARTERRELLFRTAASAHEPLSTIAGELVRAMDAIEGLQARVAVLEERSR